MDASEDVGMYRPTWRALWRQLSVLMKVFLILLALLFVVFAIIVPAMALIGPLLLFPTLLLAAYFRRNYHRCGIDSEILARVYVFTFIPGMVAVFIVEMVLTIFFVAVTYGHDILEYINHDGENPSESLVPKFNFRFAVLVFLMSFVTAACSEESLKYFVSNRARSAQPMSRFRGIVLLGAICSLSFSTAENVSYVMGPASTSLLVGIFVAFSRLLVSTPLHVLTGTIIGLNIASRDLLPAVENSNFSFWKILLVPVLVHGAFDFGLMLTLPFDSTSPELYCFSPDNCFSVLNLLSIFYCGLILVLVAIYARRRFKKIASLLDPYSSLNAATSEDQASTELDVV